MALVKQRVPDRSGLESKRPCSQQCSRRIQQSLCIHDALALGQQDLRVACRNSCCPAQLGRRHHAPLRTLSQPEPSERAGRGQLVAATSMRTLATVAIIHNLRYKHRQSVRAENESLRCH